MNVRTVAIFSKPRQPHVARVASELAGWFNDKGIAAQIVPPGESSPAVDLVVVVGGDGTLLAAVRAIGDRQTPIVAINHGGLGFLTEVTLDEMHSALDRVLSGRFTIDDRMMLEAGIFRDGVEVARHRVLNDIVINKGTLSRIIHLDAHVNGNFVASFRSDGLIVATPTGSTAYSLSAGGPVVFPSLRAMILTPICPHTLTNRPIILPPEVRVEITLNSESAEVFVTIDGQIGLPLDSGDRLRIEKSNAVVRLVAATDKNYFDILRDKLKWG